MSFNEIIILVLTIYAIIGLLAMVCAVLSDAGWRGAVFAFFCWLVIAVFLLLLTIKRVRK